MYGITEIARLLNVSEKTIRRRIKELNITESAKDKNTGKKLFSEESLLLLKKALGQPLDSAWTESRHGLDSLDNNTDSSANDRLDSLDNDRTAPRHDEKDPLIILLEKQLNTLQEQLNQKDKQIQDLSTLLSREQELNRHNQLQIEDLNKRLLTYTPEAEDNTFQEVEIRQDTSTIEKNTEQKKSFWERIFKR